MKYRLIILLLINFSFVSFAMEQSLYTEIANKLIEFKKILVKETGWFDKELIEAANIGNTNMVRTLLEKGADVASKRDDRGGLSLDRKIRPGDTGFVIALKNNHIETLAALLDSNSNVEIIDKDGYTAIMRAAASGNSEMLEMLIDKGLDINAAGKDGWTALTLAAYYGRTEIVKILLNLDIEIEATNDYNCTALMEAARKGHVEIVEILLQENAQIPEDTSEYPENIQDILEKEKKAHRGRFTKSASKKSVSRATCYDAGEA